jgi:hypothetical protein
MKPKYQHLKVVLAVFVTVACLQPFVGLAQQNQQEQSALSQQGRLQQGELLPTGKNHAHRCQGIEFSALESRPAPPTGFHRRPSCDDRYQSGPQHAARANERL